MNMDYKKVFEIGPRTRRNVLKGKIIRKDKDGADIFEDYWTDSESDESSVITPNSNFSVALPQVDSDTDSSNAVIGKQKTTVLSRPNTQTESSKSHMAELENASTLAESSFEKNSPKKDVFLSHLHISRHKKSVESRKSKNFLQIKKNLPDYDEVDLTIMQMCFNKNTSNNKNELSEIHEKDVNKSNNGNEMVENLKHIHEQKKKRTSKLLKEDNTKLFREKLHAASYVSPNKHKDEATVLDEKLSVFDITFKRKSCVSSIGLSRKDDVSSEVAEKNKNSKVSTTKNKMKHKLQFSQNEKTLEISNKNKSKVPSSSSDEGFDNHEESVNVSPDKNISHTNSSSKIKSNTPKNASIVSPKNMISTNSAKHKDQILIKENVFKENVPDNENSASNIVFKSKSFVSPCFLSRKDNVNGEADNEKNKCSTSKNKNSKMDTARGKIKCKLQLSKKKSPEIIKKNKSNSQIFSDHEDFENNAILEKSVNMSPDKDISDINDNINSSPHNSVAINSEHIEEAMNKTYDCINNSHGQITSKKRKVVEKNADEKINSKKKSKKSVGCVRRSNRRRFPPLAGWRNERLIYRYVKGEIEFIDIDQGLEIDDAPIRFLYNRMESKKKKIYKPKVAKKAKLIDAVGNEKISADVMKRFAVTPWNKSEKELEKSKQPYLIKRMFETEKIGFGFIQIEVNEEKPEQYMPEEDLQMTVFRGNIELTIQNNHYIVGEKDMFIIPKNCAYSIKNTGKIKALLSFVVGKFHFMES